MHKHVQAYTNHISHTCSTNTQSSLNGSYATSFAIRIPHTLCAVFLLVGTDINNVTATVQNYTVRLLLHTSTYCIYHEN